MAAMNESNLYRAVWRWHFYAGLVVLPLLAWMATTGALYLYKPELERLFYGRWIEGVATSPPLPVSTLIARTKAQVDGPVTQVMRPTIPGESWRMTFTDRLGQDRLAFVDPDSGALLGMSSTGGPMDLVKQLHSLSVAGPIGNALVEIAAGWAILLVLTGVYLWWPRAGNRALSLAGKVAERRFWRNLHASVGVVAGGIILFLAVTGMPWTVFWGAQFHAFVAREGIGRPPAPSAPADAHHDAHLPWSLRGTTPPHGSMLPDLGPDRALAIAEARGLSPPWTLDLPAAHGRPYRITAAAEQTRKIRVIYVDPGTGTVLQDVRYKDFGLGARLFEWGIATHQGRQYGEANRLIMLLGCLATLMLAATAPIMWWKRRHGEGLRPPPPSADRAKARGVAGIMLAVGVLFPLTGLSMLLALAGRTLSIRIGRRLGKGMVGG